ncbi:tetratricopeptide repeat-containing sensor histidine kinase [Muriicola jejuensis]|uniref:tetratricopeptide repeat-containing sensor histidine kinase n=1 Tax=Muriicola jejuensis TaxID=504488 RepID=UPI001EF8458E|nr:tetratricopeptide repeat-containing sensor histidine kinase [Muriicola jejuensis]
MLAASPGNAQASKVEELRAEIKKQQDKIDFKVTDTLYIDLLNDLAKEIRFYNADSLLSLSEKALEYSKKADYTRGQSMAYLRQGDYYSDKGERDAAINNFTKALILSRNMEDNALTLRIINNLATEYSYNGDYAKSLNNYLEGVEMAELKGEKEMLSILNENIAALYESQEDHEQALIFYQKAKKLNDEIGNDISSAETMSNLASLYAEMGKLDYAMFNVNRSISIFEKHRVMDWLAYAYETKGKVYLKQNKYQWALYWYKQGELIHQELDDDRGKIHLYNGIAEAYLGQGIDSLSQKYAMEAYDISNQIKFPEGIRDCAYTLYKINKKNGDFEKSLAFHEIFQDITETLHRTENKKSLTLLKTRAEYDQQKQELIEANQKALAKQRGLIYAAIIVLIIFAIITFFIKRAEKIQKRLNAELQAKKEILEEHEAALVDSNDTKTKLFSIIGHDLRGPIGSLQGLLQMFSDGEMTKDEFFQFIPKLKSDVDHIYFTLNNLLSWGNSQMNGATIKPSVFALESLVDDNINLLSELAKSKSIKIVSELSGNTLIWSDSNQIDIVIRNLISNALKFTPDNGMITITAKEKNDLWEVSVRDTGVGMDKVTIEKLFKKNSNITTYGTNNEKGTGLGLSLCKEMVEKNGGTIWVESVLRKGSTFFFTLPKAEDKYSQAS